MHHISVAELAAWQRDAVDFTVLDARRAQARVQDGSAIAGPLWRDPAAWLDWQDAWRASARPVVLVGAQGQELSQGLAAARRAMSTDARHLVGGMQHGRDSGLALVALGQEAASA